MLSILNIFIFQKEIAKKYVKKTFWIKKTTKQKSIFFLARVGN